VNNSLLLRTNTSFSITFCVDHYTIDILYIDSFASPSKRPSINKVYGRLLPCFQWRPITQGVVWLACQLAKAFWLITGLLQSQVSAKIGTVLN
jgi:hypothetical protein